MGRAKLYVSPTPFDCISFLGDESKNPPLSEYQYSFTLDTSVKGLAGSMCIADVDANKDMVLAIMQELWQAVEKNPCNLG